MDFKKYIYKNIFTFWNSFPSFYNAVINIVDLADWGNWKVRKTDFYLFLFFWIIEVLSRLYRQYFKTFKDLGLLKTLKWKIFKLWLSQCQKELIYFDGFFCEWTWPITFRIPWTWTFLVCWYKFCNKFLVVWN